MVTIDQQLKDQIASLPDRILLHILEGQSDSYTPEAIASASEEIAKRGGIEVLKQELERSESKKSGSDVQAEHPSNESPESDEILVRLKKMYPLLVLVAYGLFMYVINASFWFYWLCLFAFLGALFAVLFVSREITLEEEGKEVSGVVTHESESLPSKDEQQP